MASRPMPQATHMPRAVLPITPVAKAFRPPTDTRPPLAGAGMLISSDSISRVQVEYSLTAPTWAAVAPMWAMQLRWIIPGTPLWPDRLRHPISLGLSVLLMPEVG